LEVVQLRNRLPEGPPLATVGGGGGTKKPNRKGKRHKTPRGAPPTPGGDNWIVCAFLFFLEKRGGPGGGGASSPHHDFKGRGAAPGKRGLHFLRPQGGTRQKHVFKQWGGPRKIKPRGGGGGGTLLLGLFLGPRGAFPVDPPGPRARGRAGSNPPGAFYLAPGGAWCPVEQTGGENREGKKKKTNQKDNTGIGGGPGTTPTRPGGGEKRRGTGVQFPPRGGRGRGGAPGLPPAIPPAPPGGGASFRDPGPPPPPGPVTHPVSKKNLVYHHQPSGGSGEEHPHGGVGSTHPNQAGCFWRGGFWGNRGNGKSRLFGRGGNWGFSGLRDFLSPTPTIIFFPVGRLAGGICPLLKKTHSGG